MTTQEIQPASGAYRYSRDRDGCDDVWLIHGPDDKVLASVPFWDEPDTADWVQRSEATARLIVHRLNMHEELLAALEVALPVLKAEDARIRPGNSESLGSEAYARALGTLAREKTQRGEASP